MRKLIEAGGPDELEVDVQERRPDERDDHTWLADMLPGESGHEGGPGADQREPLPHDRVVRLVIDDQDQVHVRVDVVAVSHEGPGDRHAGHACILPDSRKRVAEELAVQGGDVHLLSFRSEQSRAT
ncbi:hypothetical protein ACFWMX_11385 [Streptomyces sp. NPDC058378]|uniref:hypothetical protein n=1 Tax=Streptomyces sp. NPDC058378 TaxID=3346469 RepID=UPI0036669770